MDEKLSKKAARKAAREKQLNQMRRDLLEREIGLDKLSLQKIKDKWVDALLSIRIPEMHDNLRHILHYMEKLIESDTFLKSEFQEERDDYEEQTLLQSKSHSQALEKLAGIYRGRVHDLNEEYKKRVEERRKEAQEEFNTLNTREIAIQDSLQTVLYTMELNSKKNEQAMTCDLFLKIDDEKSRHAEALENLRTKLDKKMEKRWSEITSTLNTYKENTQSRRLHYEQLKAKDNQDSKIIYQQMKKTQKLFEQLDEMKKCQDECYAPKELISTISDLQEERLKFFSSFNFLKKIVTEELKVDAFQLKTLTVSSNSVVEELKKIRRKAEQILTLYRICMKFETECEKITPVGGDFHPMKHHKHKRRGLVEEKKETDKSENTLRKYDIMQDFWKKVGGARISCLALTQCIQHLSRENALLRKYLAIYLRQVSVRKIRK